MNHAGLALSHALRGTGSIGWLREAPGIPFAIRLKRDPPSIRGPHRKTVPAAEGQPPHRARAGELVNPHNRFLPVVGTESDAASVGRYPRVLVLIVGRELQ